MDSILLDVNETRKNLAKYNRVSWSKLNEFSICPGQWFVRNYADIVNLEKAILEHSRSIHGTMIQKMFEIFINERIYERENLKDLDDVLTWFYVNSNFLFDLLVFPFEEQFSLLLQNPRYYFRRKHGKQRLTTMHSRGLDTVFKKGFSPCFIDYETFNREHGSKEKFLDHLNSLYKPILELFLEYEIILNFMLSEIYLEAELSSNQWISGQIDFIYNKNSWSTFNSVTGLKNDYMILDGKYKLSSFTKKEQLFFYAILCHLKYKKYPNYVAFIDWSNAKFDFHEFDPTYLNKLKIEVGTVVQTGFAIKRSFEEFFNKGLKQVTLENIMGLTFNPSVQNCVFCPILNSCIEAESANVNEVHTGINNKRECEAYLKDLDLDPSEDIHEIKLKKE